MIEMRGERGREGCQNGEREEEDVESQSNQREEDGERREEKVELEKRWLESKEKNILVRQQGRNGFLSVLQPDI